jgi:NADPH:quinone reductase-like Zn-dependent oxidoreductase
MKAIILNGSGGTDKLVKAEIPIPEIQDHEVLVEIKAVSINPVDIKTRKGGGLTERLKEFDPVILGWDISGVVTEAGRSVTGFKKGDEVFGMVNFPGHGRAYAEYVAAPASHLALKPSNISHEEAAAASLAALTAWQVLKGKAQVKPGHKILIHAAAGGVGHFAVQMSAYLGAEVTGTASSENRDFVLGLGASFHVDYEKQKFEEVLSDMDFVLDTIGGDYIDRSLKVLKPGGTIICIPSSASENIVDKAAARGMKGSRFLVISDGTGMREIAGLLKEGKIKSFISGKFSFEEFQSAHMQIETAKTRGKIVVTLQK